MKRIIARLKRLNEALPELLFTMFLYGVLAELIGVWFVEDKIRYTSGLVIGLLLGCFLSLAIARSLWDTVAVASKKDQVVVSTKAILRYAVVVIATMAMCYFNLGSILSWFIGVMGLKVSALAQPMIHKIFFGKKNESEDRTLFNS